MRLLNSGKCTNFGQSSFPISNLNHAIYELFYLVVSGGSPILIPLGFIALLSPGTKMVKLKC